MSSHRMLRVRELLKRELGEVIRQELPVAEAGLVSVNDVHVSSDLHSATVYVGILGTADQKKRSAELLRKKRKLIQSLVARAVILKYTPTLRFILDESLDRANRVLQIIEDLEKKSSPEE